MQKTCEKYNQKDPVYKYRVESHEWAWSLHGKIVRYGEKIGVAIFSVAPGGWGYVKMISDRGVPIAYCSWARHREDINELPLAEMILHRLKRDGLGEIMGMADSLIQREKWSVLDYP